MTDTRFALTAGLGLLGAVALLVAGSAVGSSWLQALALLPLAVAAGAKVLWTYRPRDVLLATGLIAAVIAVGFLVATATR